MSSVDSIWADMKKETHISSHSKMGFVSEDACKSSSIKKKKKKSSKFDTMKEKKKENKITKSDVLAGLQTSYTRAASAFIQPQDEDIPELHLSGDELVMKLQRPIQQTKDENLSVRKTALITIHELVCVKLKDKLSDQTMSLLLDELSKPILKRFADEGAEKIRELAVDIMTYLISKCLNLIGLLPYLYPALMDRLGHQHGYDTETNIFVHDVELHKAWKRGTAISRQDKADSGVEGVITVKVVEPSEEIRLKLLKLMSTLTRVLVSRGTTNLVHPYFHDTMLFIQAHLRDPYPEVKLEACNCLTSLARTPSLNQGMVYYALAVARAALPVLRHRHAKVRAAAVRLVTSAIAVPHKAKCRGAGTDAIVDLIGYTPEDTIPITAFYGGHNSVNYLAELCVDSVASVRLETARMLAEFITSLPDRYDHRTRLVPFLLNAVNDQEESVCECAMKALSIAGAEYEKENQEDIIERRQYGVDGDRRAQHYGSLPAPFKDRPRLGERLYVRGCTRRFLKPLLKELTDWKGKTKLSSARLLLTVIVYCEEALTQDLNVLVPDLCGAYKALQPDETDVFDVLSQCCELLGRFIAPDSYVPFLLPRLKGELAVLPGGIDGQGRSLVLLLTKLFMRGSAPKELIIHSEELSEALTDQVVLTSSIPELKSRALDACDSLVKALANSGASLEAHYLSSGRLAHKSRLFEALIRGLLVWRSDPSLSAAATTCLSHLACVEARDEAQAKIKVRMFLELRSGTEQLKERNDVEIWLTNWLIGKYCVPLSTTVCENYPLNALWDCGDIAHIVLTQLLTCNPPDMIILLEKLHVLFTSEMDITEMDGDFWKEWEILLCNLCKHLMLHSEVDVEGRTQNAVLGLFNALCFRKSSEFTDMHSSILAVVALLALCDRHGWRLRRMDGVKCASILATALKPSVPPLERSKSCAAISMLLRSGIKGRLKSHHVMVASNTVKKEWLDVACIVCNPLVAMLADPVEEVRLNAINALEELVFFLSPMGTFKVSEAGQTDKDSLDEGWAKVNISELSEDIGAGRAVDYISLRGFVEAVAPLIISDSDFNVEEEEDKFIDSLDTLLRQVAVVDPKEFISSLSIFTLSGRLGELEAHGELLVKLGERAKKEDTALPEKLPAVDLELD